MFKRLFWMAADIDNVGLRTLQGMFREFNETRKTREAELNKQYADRLR